MIRKVDDGFIAECDVCGAGLDEDGNTGNVAVFATKGDAGIFIDDNDWGRIGDYVVCPDCVGRINRGEIEPRFVYTEGCNEGH